MNNLQVNHRQRNPTFANKPNFAKSISSKLKPTFYSPGSFAAQTTHATESYNGEGECNEKADRKYPLIRVFSAPDTCDLQIRLPKSTSPPPKRVFDLERDFTFSDVPQRTYEWHLKLITKDLLQMSTMPKEIPEPLILKHIPNTTKKLLVLGLDDTIIHSYRKRRPYSIAINVKHFGKEHNFWVTLRPYVKFVLRTLKQYYHICIFTTAIEAYALEILNVLDPNRDLISSILSRDHCTFEEGIYLKDLRIFQNYNKKDIVVVDNRVRSFYYDLDNGVPLLSWIDDPADNELLPLSDFLINLAQEDDVRVRLREHFDLKNFLFNLI